MRKCPNCGQPTARTEDWACQWCGHPLLSDSYKKIPKTFKELKDERLFNQKSLIAEEIEASNSLSDIDLSPRKSLQSEPEAVVESTQISGSKVISEISRGLKSEPNADIGLNGAL